MPGVQVGIPRRGRGHPLTTGSNEPAKRPDLIDLIGPDFDQPASAPADRTLIICSAPRTGSYELCRYLTAAGIGVPHEYFNPSYASRLAKRWAFRGDALAESELGRYIDLLRRRRSQNGVFATKLQFRHFDGILRNHHGAALFQNACLIHLFRPDIANQFASLRAALESGSWDFSVRQTTQPLVRHQAKSDAFIQQALAEMHWLLREDAGFRGLFVLLGLNPIFVTSEELFKDPRGVVGRIANAMSVTVDAQRLEQAIAASAPYGHDEQREKSMVGLVESFKEIAFQKRRMF
jgi:trehalose 2-sulfotransferase